MDIFKVIKERRSIRKYKDKNIEEDKLKKVLYYTHLAPSARNSQPWKIIIVENKGENKEKILDASKGQKFVIEAPYTIIICTNEKESYPVHGDYMTSFAVDGAILMDHLTLIAFAEGLGTCWIAKFNEKKVKEYFNIPDEYRVIALTPLGYPDEVPKDKGRKDLKEIVFKNKWGEKMYD